MTDPRIEWIRSHTLTFDYDVDHWIPVPTGDETDASTDVQAWARDTATAWAQDLGRESDPDWVDSFRVICEVAAAKYYEDLPDQVFLHMRTPEGRPPSAAVATLSTWPADLDTAGIVAKLADSYERSNAAEPPVVDEISLPNGLPAQLLTVHVHGTTSERELRRHLLWQVHEYMILSISMAGPAIDRILEASTDVLDLAAACGVAGIDA